MNFGERLKQIRAEKGLTQPQLAEIVGIEQSYLSKLENDKSVPSADMFTTILAGLGMDATTFLKEVDPEVQATTLKHIPAVTQVGTREIAVQVHQSKRWLFGSALAWVLGFALMLAANDGIFFSNKLYRYSSPGVLLAGEAEDIFHKYLDILELKRHAQILTMEEFAKEKTEFRTKREKPTTVEYPDSRGTVFYQDAENGRRRFELVKVEYAQARGNRILQFLGAVILVSGFVGLFIDWRLRRLKNNKRK